MDEEHLNKAALRGEPSHVWRAGQERRLKMIQQAGGERCRGRVLVDGCGLGAYLARLAPEAALAVGLDIEFERTQDAYARVPATVCGVGSGRGVPADNFDLLLSHEVLEHVQDDGAAIREMVRVLRPGGRLLAGFTNPDLYLFDDASLEEGRLVVRHRLPYSDLTHLEPGEHERLNGPGATLQFSHSMDTQIGGQLRAGFVITHFAQAPMHAGPTAEYMPGYFATVAVRP